MFEADAEQWSEDQHADAPLDDKLVEMFLNTVPVAKTLLRLIDDRGWTGWTKLERKKPHAAPTGSRGGSSRWRRFNSTLIRDWPLKPPRNPAATPMSNRHLARADLRVGVSVTQLCSTHLVTMGPYAALV